MKVEVEVGALSESEVRPQADDPCLRFPQCWPHRSGPHKFLHMTERGGGVDQADAPESQPRDVIL